MGNVLVLLATGAVLAAATLWGLAQPNPNLGVLPLTAILIFVTAFYAHRTHVMADEMRKQRRVGFLPLLYWQSPQASVEPDLAQQCIRLRLNLVLWNIGQGAARVTHATARASGGEFKIAHFSVPSLIPRDELTIRLYRDVPLPSLFSNPGEAEGAAADVLSDDELTILVHYDDLVETRHYETRPRVKVNFSMAKGRLTHRNLEPEPPESLSHPLVDADFTFSDAHSVERRTLSQCDQESCRKHRADG